MHRHLLHCDFLEAFCYKESSELIYITRNIISDLIENNLAITIKKVFAFLKRSLTFNFDVVLKFLGVGSSLLTKQLIARNYIF